MMIGNALAGVLRSGRAEFNARFAEARLRFPDLDAQEFGDFLARYVSPLIDAVDRTQPDHTAAVTSAAYDIALNLVGEKLAGNSARKTVINEGWRELFPTVAPHIAVAPQRTIASLTNALHHLDGTPGARPRQWIELVAEHGTACENVEQLLALGQFAAWRSGLAHFREGALNAADTLPGSLAAKIVGNVSIPWTELRKHFAANPWFDPTRVDLGGPRLEKRAGAFRGFGGLFAQPPEVAVQGQDFVVRSAGECWHLIADACGATFHRANAEEFTLAQKSVAAPSLAKWKQKRVMVRGQSFEFPEIGEITSVAETNTTLALTGADTHAITLIAL